MADLIEVQIQFDEFLKEIIRASSRCIEEAWKETPRPQRDGTEMILIPESLFSRLEDAVRAMEKKSTIA